jgi:hypothetical protein
LSTTFACTDAPVEPRRGIARDRDVGVERQHEVALAAELEHRELVGVRAPLVERLHHAHLDAEVGEHLLDERIGCSDAAGDAARACQLATVRVERAVEDLHLRRVRHAVLERRCHHDALRVDHRCDHYPHVRGSTRTRARATRAGIDANLRECAEAARGAV